MGLQRVWHDWSDWAQHGTNSRSWFKSVESHLVDYSGILRDVSILIYLSISSLHSVTRDKISGGIPDPVTSQLQTFQWLGHLSPSPGLPILHPSWAPYCCTCSVASLWDLHSTFVHQWTSAQFKDKINFTFSLKQSFGNHTQRWLLHSLAISFILYTSPQMLLSLLCECECINLYHSIVSSSRELTIYDSRPLAQL